MNEKAVGLLVDAAMRGVRQHFGGLGGDDELCAVGVLWDALGRPQRVHEEVEKAFGLRLSASPCQECGAENTSELYLIAHLNDDHRADFLTIARKLGPDAA